MRQRHPDAPGQRTPPERRANDPRNRRSKNIALMLILVGFAVLIYIVAIIRMSGG